MLSPTLIWEIDRVVSITIDSPSRLLSPPTIERVSNEIPSPQAKETEEI